MSRIASSRTSSGWQTWALALLVVLLGACAEPSRPSSEEPEPEAPACNDPEVRAVVEQLGARLQQVSRLAPDSLVVRAVREHYAQLVTADLLAGWEADPSRAPGRDVSSPWPDRIEVLAVAPVEGGACRVEGAVVYVTSAAQAEDGEAAREPVVLHVAREGGRWRISAYGHGSDPEAVPSGEEDAEAAADVVRRYYEAIGERDFRRAYALWGDGGAASRQTFEAFEAGFGETDSVSVEVGALGRIEGAAGSRFVVVPVTVRAVTTAGEEQRFEGTYTLRRSVVDGASPAQRRWHLYAADVERVR